VESVLRNGPAGDSPSNEAWVPETDADRNAVRDQLDRLLASHLFSISKRYPGLLKYIVEETLAGRGSQLKERTLGVEVFGRAPGYDTNLDPVVRMSAAQVRQRAAQYYQEGNHGSDIRIELLPGSYVPVFHRPAAVAARAACQVVSLDPVPEAKPRRIGTRMIVAAACVGVLAALIGLLVFHAVQSDPATEFWGPVWNRAKPLVICVPGRFPTQEDPTQTAGVAISPPIPAGQPLTIVDSERLNSIAWPDATSLYTLAGFIQAHGQRCVVRRERDTPLSDLRGGATVLIGGFNNDWLLRLTSRYRFTYQESHQTGECWIADAQNPSRHDWHVNIHTPYAKFDEDYGIISRVWDASTEGWVVAASGIASYCTISAGEFLTNPNYLALIDKSAPAGWAQKNIQVVFSTRVFNGYAGPPRILAVHLW
jgi:hypothetical protein